ncbi:hypothetical protein [Bacillus sp. AFS073361]|uniref:hypothetical protein n=1 Tax=Bacillus sp. AFS073361 TaxID=2033511 RepID=UPI00211D1F7B|nr:hypothetical protein [Bacillus sp. AFS073361]
MQTKSQPCTIGLVMDFLAVSQQAAIAAYPWIGVKGIKSLRMELGQLQCETA